MSENFPKLETEPLVTEREWTVDGVTVLTAAVSLPRPLDRKSRTARRIDRFYRLQRRSYLQYCEKWLFPAAAEAYRRAAADSGPLPCRSASVSYRVTCGEGPLWSLYSDLKETAEGRTEILRLGDTWDLRTGYPLPLPALFARHTPWRRELIAPAEAEIRRQEAAGAARYREDWPQRLRKYFSRENFYVTPEEVRYYWQMYAIAPSAEGIPTFRLPFGEGGCRRPGGEDLPAPAPETRPTRP